MTGVVFKRIRPQVGNELFILTYGDGVSNINVKNLLDCLLHRKNIAR
jgi:glucose-1-phosphate cytidylyltransferase